MNKKTVKLLNQLNIKFYKRTQEYFNRSRQYSWAGWGRLLPYFHLQGQTLKVLKVLDVGCGNGRFGEFLEKKLKSDIDYTGMDNNEYLLEQVKKNVKEAKIIKQGVLRKWKVEGKFDAVVLIGLMHHIPGEDNRIRILKQAKERLNKNGILIFTTWRFKDLERMAKKIVKKHKFKNLEENDYILDWKKGVRAYRYCHYIDGDELRKIIGKLRMKTLDIFEADAKEGRGNKYIVLQQKGI